MDIGYKIEFSKKDQVEVYAIGELRFWLFIFWILDFKNRWFINITKQLWVINSILFAKKVLIILAEVCKE